MKNRGEPEQVSAAESLDETHGARQPLQKIEAQSQAQLGYLDYETHFGTQEGTSTGGKTGSSQKTSIITGKDYQVKESITKAKISVKNLFRQAKAGLADSENFSQFFGSAVLGANMDSVNGPKLVDNVELVYNKKEHEIGIASEYLQRLTHRSLDRYAQEHYEAKLQEKSEHIFVKFAGRNQEVGDFSLQEQETDTEQEKHQKAILRKDIATNLAGSVLVGNHDFNPGNMVPLKDQREDVRIAQVDLGHAFNDLLASSKTFGGQLRNKDNMVLDFLNREEIIHAFPSHRIPKLWRDYEGIVLSPELVEAFKELSDDAHIAKTTQGIAVAKAKFTSLIKDLNPEQDKKAIEHIKKSLIAINVNAGNITKIDSSLSINEVLDQTCENLEKFCKSNQQQMKGVATLIEMQQKIDKLVDPQINRAEGELLGTEISNIYRELSQKPEFIAHDNKGKQINGIQWVKTDRDSPAFQGTLDEYIVARTNKKQLQNLQQKIDSLIIDEQLNGTRNNDQYQEIATQYEQLAKRNGVTLGDNKGIKWERTDRNDKPIEGTLEKYIETRSQSAEIKSRLEDKQALKAGTLFPSETNIIEDYPNFAGSRTRSSAISASTLTIDPLTSVPSQKPQEHEQLSEKLNQGTREAVIISRTRGGTILPHESKTKLSLDLIEQAKKIGNSCKDRVNNRQKADQIPFSKANSPIQR